MALCLGRAYADEYLHRGLRQLDRRPPSVPVSAPDAAALLDRDTERELFWPQSAGIPEEALLDRSPFESTTGQ